MLSIIYRCDSPKNYITKTKTALCTPQVYLKDNVDVINPVVYLNTSVTTTTSSELSQSDALRYANYVYLYDFGRYYFITNKIVGKNGMITFQLHCDVLSTFKTHYQYISAVVARSDNQGSALIPDGELQFIEPLKYSIFTPNAVSMGNLVNVTFNTNLGSTAKCVAFTALVNDEGQTGLSYSGGTATPPSGSGLPYVNYDNYSAGYYTRTQAITPANMDTIANYALRSTTRSSFIKSIVVYPFDLSEVFDLSGQYEESVLLGGDDTGVSAKVVQYTNYLVLFDYTFSSGTSFTDYEPYTHYELYIPYVGWVEMQASKILGKRVLVYYDINFEDGSATATIYNYTNKIVLYSSSCQLGHKISVSSTNEYEISRVKFAQNISHGVMGLMSIASIGVGGASGSLKGVMSGASGLVGQSTKALGETMNTYVTGNAHITGGLSGSFHPQKVTVRRSYKDTFNSVASVKGSLGQPCNKSLVMSTLSGYAEISEIKIPLEVYASGSYQVALTETERDELTNILKSGVYCPSTW